jgi:hypothetical protein
MPDTLRTIIAKIFTSRDELSIGNLRGSLWAAFLVFPLSFIICDMRAFGPETTAFGLESFELLNFTLGFGWFVLFFLPKRFIIPALRLSAVVCAVILPFQMLLPEGLPLLAMFMAFEFFIGICLGSSFYIFCFTLNNVERLLGVCITLFILRYLLQFSLELPAFVAFMKTWGSAAAMVLYLAVVFCSFRKKDRHYHSEPDNNNYQSSIFLLIILVLLCYLIWCTINYKMLDENVSSLVFGIASPVAIALVFIIHFHVKANALNTWILSLVFSLMGVSLILFDTPFALNAGSFFCGLGDSTSFIITSFMCGGTIKLSKSLKMYRIYCLIHFIFYI